MPPEISMNVTATFHGAVVTARETGAEHPVHLRDSLRAPAVAGAATAALRSGATGLDPPS